MCGISGIIYKNTPKQTEKFKASANLQAHRGPDYTGYFGNNTVDLMHHRLSILDLDERSNQPFTNKNQDKILVYNGEVYNYKGLKKQYNLKTTTTSDTEVLFQLISKSDFKPDELNGIFAFAFYDVKKHTLQLYRDRLGVKPLYYYKDSKQFIFASEAKVIYNFLDELEIDHQALSEFLTFGHSNSDQTLISGVKKLTPGTSLTLDVNNFLLEQNEFWSIRSQVERQIKPTYKEAKKKTIKLLDQAVKRQCMSDVPIGAYLSGGIDSSAVVALASKYTNRSLQTYSVNFDNSSKSELLAAAKIAAKFGTEHHEFEVSTIKADDFLTELIYQYDEPFADPAMIPLHLIAKKASKNLKVVLQGDGGDEIFGGYGRYLDLQHYRLRKLSFQALKNFSPNKNVRQSFAQRYKRFNHENKAELMASLVERDAFVNISPYLFNFESQKLVKYAALESYYRSYDQFKKLPLVQGMLYTDMENILRHKYLEKVDKVNMHCGIEARVPLIDDALVDYVMRLPSSFKIKKGITKYFLRDLLKGLIPDDVLSDRKRSFGTPFPDWTNKRLFNYAKDYFERAKTWATHLNYELLCKELYQLHHNKIPHKSKIVWKFLVLTIWLSFYRSKISNI